MADWPSVTDAQQEVHTVRSKDDSFDIRLFHFTKQGVHTSAPAPVILYLHGGGYFAASVKHYQKFLELYVSQSGIPLVGIDFRLAPEFPFPTPVNDAYSALEYVSKNADLFKIDPSRMILLGDSSGAGIAAGLAIKARDEGLTPPVAKQMIIAGMLDDRSTATKNEELALTATWTHEDSITSWVAYLGGPDKVASNEAGDVSEYAALSRVESVKGLPSLDLEVTDMDILRDEKLEYARRVAAENIEMEIHLWRSVPHNFELFVPRIQAARIAFQSRVRAIKSV